MGSIFGWVTDALLGGLSHGFAGLTDSIVLLGLTLFALALGFFAISYLHKRREMLHQERMAALIKGLHYAGVAHDVFKRQTDSRQHLLRGLRWVMGGTAASGVMYGCTALQPAAEAADALSGALIGLIPGAIGLAHLIFSWICSRHRSAAPTAQGFYRVAARRY